MNNRTNYPSIVLRSGDISKQDFELLVSCKRVALDIETTGLNWQSDKICTCQLYGETQEAFVLRLSDTKPKYLCNLIECRNINKVFHYAVFDLRFISKYFDVKPENISCTKIASKLLFKDGDKNQHTLKHLIQEYFSINLNKEARMSDWTSQSLTVDQLAYAINDVFYLPALLDSLMKDLAERRLQEIAERCFNHIPTQVALELMGYSGIFEY